MTPQDFIAKWQHAELKERTTAQTHFNDVQRWKIRSGVGQG
jgi:hypothetical protein